MSIIDGSNRKLRYCAFKGMVVDDIEILASDGFDCRFEKFFRNC